MPILYKPNIKSDNELYELLLNYEKIPMIKLIKEPTYYKQLMKPNDYLFEIINPFKKWSICYIVSFNKRMKYKEFNKINFLNCDLNVSKQIFNFLKNVFIS